MNINELMASIKQKTTPRKKVDFNEYDLHFELEPLTSIDEMKILGTSKNFDGAEYIDAVKKCTLACSIKKINDIDLSGDTVEYTESDGIKKSKSKFLYMSEYLGSWPSIVLDVLFEAFGDMQMEAESKIRETAKFERFKLTEKVEIETPSKFRKIEEKDSAGDSEVETLNKQVEKEVSEVNQGIADAESEAIAKIKS